MVQRGLKRRRFGALTGLMLWAALAALPLAVAAGSAGDLDTSFGTGGSTMIGVDDAFATLLGIQSDGKFVLGMNVDGPVVDGVRTMSWLIMRRNADGTADESFGTSGAVRLFGDFRNDEFHDGLVDSSDRILCAGRALIETTVTTTSGKGKKQKTTTTTTRLNAFTVVRLTPDGALDTGFGTDGSVHTPLPGARSEGGQALAVALQSDGKIVAAGEAFGISGSTDGGGKGKKNKGGGPSSASDAVALVRYHTNGDIDTAFGTNGITLHDVTPDDEAPSRGAIGIQSSGKILIGSSVSGIGEHWILTRYDANGAVDTDFGPITVTDHYVEGILVDASDRIVAVGSTLSEMVLARYLADGTPDSSFGSSGYTSTSFGEYARGFSAALQSDGKIAVMCAVGEQGATDVEAIPVRFTSTGALDSGFGLGGHGQPLGASGVDVYPLFDLELDASGNLVISGAVLDPSDGSYDSYLARWCGN